VKPSEEAAGGRREEILQAAKRLFAEQGFRETNLNDVAELLGIRRQAFYYYFSSKEDILIELVTRAGRAVDSAQELLDSSLEPLDKLRELIKVHVRETLSDADIFRIQLDEVPKLQSARGEALRKEQEAYMQRVADVIAAGQQDGSVMQMPSSALARLIIGMSTEVVRWFDAGAGLSIEEMADYVAQVAINGVRADPPRLAS